MTKHDSISGCFCIPNFENGFVSHRVLIYKYRKLKGHTIMEVLQMNIEDVLSTTWSLGEREAETSEYITLL
jgi:hypothetical protein